MLSDIQPNLKSDTKVLQSGATHTVFNDSDTELLNNGDTSITKALIATNILPEPEAEKSIGMNTISHNARRNRRRRNRKTRKLKQTQQSVGGEDDVMVAVSKIYENPIDDEVSLKVNKNSEVEASLIDNINSNIQGNQSNIGDDFGVDFTVDFDSYPELSGIPRVGDVLVYKVGFINIILLSFTIVINT